MFQKRLGVLIWALALAGSVFGQFQAGSPWPRLQANNSNSGRFAGLGFSDGVARWTTQVPNAPSFIGSPVIGADGTIYLASIDGAVYAFSPAGTLLWSTFLDGGVNSPAIGSDGTIYVVGGYNVYALSSGPTGGKILWQTPTSSWFYGSPTVGPDGNVYAAGWSGTVFALSPGPTGGAILWQTATGDKYNFTCPAIGADGTMYVAGINGNVFALSSGPGGGAILWQTSTNVPFHDSPAIGNDGTVYTAGESGQVFAFSPGPAGGAILWNTSLRASFYNSPAIGPDGTLYLAGLGGQIVCAVSPGPSGGSVLWSAFVNDNFFGPPAIGGDGTIYAEGRSGTVYALGSGRSGGSIKWTSTIAGDSLYGSPAIASDGAVYVAGMNGNLCAIGSKFGSIPVKTFTINPAAVDGGDEAIGTITLLNTAPSGGAEVGISSSDPSVTVPNSVKVPAGRKSIAFDILTSPVSGAASVTIIALSDGFATSANLSVLGAAVSFVSLSPTSVIGGDSSTGSVTLSSPAPVGGWSVNLSTQYPEYVAVPKTVTVAAGSKTATFKITTKQPGATIACEIYAADASGKASATLTVYGDSLSTLGLQPTTIGGNGASTGRITLTSSAPPGNWLVKISCDYPDSVSVPSSVVVHEGNNIATFPITTKQMKAKLVCPVHATLGSQTLSATLTIDGDSLSSLTLSPATIGVNGASTGTITLTAPAPLGGWLVKLTDSKPDSVFVPASVLIPEGATSATFTITISAKQSTPTFECDIIATDGDLTKTETLKVAGDSISGFALNPTTIGGGGSSIGTVTLSSPAPVGGWLVSLSSQNPIVTVPTTVLVPAKATSINFNITSSQPTQTITSLITATDDVSSHSATLTVIGDSLSSLTVGPASVVAGGSSTLTVTVKSPAPVGGWLVFLSSQLPNNVWVPDFVIVPSGATQTSISITAGPTDSNYTCLITANDTNITKTATLTVTKS